MSEPMVYIVTAGSYSDYHIVAVFYDETAAKRYMETHDDYESQVEAYSINSVTPMAADYFEAIACDTPGDDGHGSAPPGVRRVRHTHDWISLRAGYPMAWHWTAKDRGQPDGAYYGRAVALDADTALKIAQDAMYQYKAEREGL